MVRVSSLSCQVHADIFQCPDVLISYISKFDEYGLIIHDGGTSVIGIQFCPFCGGRLPESKRDLWFDTLEAIGFSDPANQDIPDKFKTDDWFRQKP